jgi:hypothetical protein
MAIGGPYVEISHSTKALMLRLHEDIYHESLRPVLNEKYVSLYDYLTFNM